MNVAVRLVPLTFTFLGVTSCVDTDPLPYTRPPVKTAPDAGTGDAGDAGASTPQACVECVTGESGACRPLYDDCAATEGCPELVQCLFRDGCFTVPDLDTRISCGQPCFDELGIVSGLQPSLEAAIPINGCTQNECRAECIRE